MENMIKFYRGLVGNLPETGVNGALYITTDEGAIYYGTGTGMKRLGDFVQVANVASLPEKAHESCLYYCVAENILAKWNGTEWKQINKQPTAEELKGLLGLGSMAYLSEVSEGNLEASLKEKINTVAQGNHSHSNKTVLDGITSEKVAAWDAAEGNAKSYTDGKDSAMNTRVVALETAIGENGSVATQIKTAIEALDYTDTAVDGEYVSAVNEVDGKISVTRKALPDYSNTYDAKGAADTAFENAKAYADGLASNYDEKGAAAGVKTELTTEINKKVDKVEGKDLIATSEITRLAGMSTGANKVEASTNNGSIKIDGVETVVYTHPDKHSISDVTGLQDALDGKQAAGDYATNTALNNVDAKFASYNTTTVQKGIDDAQDARIKAIEDDYLVEADIANFETKENVKKVSDDLAAYIESNDVEVANRYTKEEADGKFAVKGEDSYDDTEVRGLISGNTEAIATKVAQSDYDVKVKALEDAIATKQDIIPANTYDVYGSAATAESNAKSYVDGKFEDANLDQYTTEQEVKDIVDGVIAGAVDGDTITGLANLVEYLNTHGGEAKEMGAAIDVLEGKVETIEGKPAYGITSTQISNWDNEVGAKALAETKTTTAEVKEQIEAYGYATEADLTLAEGRIATLEAIDHDAYKAADATLKSELQAEIDSDVKVVNDALEAYKTSNNTEVGKKANSADVYAKTETFTKDEVNAAIEAAVNQAHTWGEF